MKGAFIISCFVFKLVLKDHGNYCCIHMTFVNVGRYSLVVAKLESLDGKLCLHYDRNAAFV